MRKFTTIIVLTSLGVALMGAPAFAAPGGVPGAPSDTPAPPSDPGQPPEPGSGTPGTPAEVSIADEAVTEGGTAQVDVTLSAASANDTTVDWATADGSADAADYTGGADTLTIPAGDTSGTIEIPTTDDDAAEGDETFTVTLSNPSANATIAEGTATVTIIDNDEALPHASFDPSQANVTEGEVAVLGFVLSEPSTEDVTLNWSINPTSTATAGDDYVVPAATTTVITAGETTAAIQIQTIDDAETEDQENIILNLQSADGATTGVGNSAIVLIADNDAPEVDCVDDGLEPANDSQENAEPHDSTETGIFSTVCPDDVDWWQTTVNADEAVLVHIVPDSDHLDGTVLVAEFLEDGAAEPTVLPDCESAGPDDPGCFFAEDDPSIDGSINGWRIEITEPTAGGTLFYSIALPFDGPESGYDYVLEPLTREPLM